MTEKEKLLDFVKKLTADELNYLACNYQEIVALLEASAPRPPLSNSELTA